MSFFCRNLCRSGFFAKTAEDESEFMEPVHASLATADPSGEAGSDDLSEKRISPLFPPPALRHYPGPSLPAPPILETWNERNERSLQLRDDCPASAPVIRIQMQFATV